MHYLYDIFIYPIELIVEFIYARANRVFANPGLSIIAVSLLVNILVLPLYNRSDAMQEEERRRQAAMKHWSDHIKKTFKGDERFMIQSAYYRQQNYKPVYALRGSFSLLLQIPFFIAAYHFLSNLGDLQGTSFLMLRDLGQQDGLIRIGDVSINLLPVLMTGINIVSGALYTKGFSVKEKLQLYGMALIFLVLLYTSPSGLVFYWTLNNLFSLGKNIFLKLIPPTRKARAACLSAVGIAGALLLLKMTSVMTKLRLALLIGFVIVTQLPLLFAFLPERKPGRSLALPENGALMVLSSLFLTVLMGGVISSAVVASSPAEFMSGGGPGKLVINNLLIYAGFFMVWLLIFYYLAGDKGRGAFAAGPFALGLTVVVTFMFVGRDLGIMSSVFKFDNAPAYSRAEMLLSPVITLLLIALAAALAAKKPVLARRVSLVMLISAVCLTAVNGVSIAGKVKEIEANSATGSEEECRIRLSRDGENVVVLMLDRAISGYVPYIFEEKPELREQFSGFTYYRNTLSFGSFTNIATPALFGGYEYTPAEINARPDETLRDKHDEALLLMPTLFSENGYAVSIFDPPYAGYAVPSDLSIFDGLENTDAYGYTERYSAMAQDGEFNERFEQYQKRTLVWYCVFKSVPVPLQSRVYADGGYSSTEEPFSGTAAFKASYYAMDALSSITSVEDGIDGGFVMMDNEITHNPAILSVPDYTPAMSVSSDPYGDRERFSGIRMESEEQISHYHVNMAAFLKLGEWFDYLREQGVYDNTRIIIVSDHGWFMHSFDEYVFGGGDIEVQAYWALLMVKDFGADAGGVSDEFMTIADVPTLALDGVIADAVNPATGRRISSDEKTAHPQLVTTSLNFEPFANNGYVMDLSDGDWWSVHDDIFREDNWRYVSAG